MQAVTSAIRNISPELALTERKVDYYLRMMHLGNVYKFHFNAKRY